MKIITGQDNDGWYTSFYWCLKPIISLGRVEHSLRTGVASNAMEIEEENEPSVSENRENVVVNLWQLPADGILLYNREFNILCHRAWLVIKSMILYGLHIKS
jgi:hypothetical protein